MNLLMLASYPFTLVAARQITVRCLFIAIQAIQYMPGDQTPPGLNQRLHKIRLLSFLPFVQLVHPCQVNEKSRPCILRPLIGYEKARKNIHKNIANKPIIPVIESAETSKLLALFAVTLAGAVPVVVGCAVDVGLVLLVEAFPWRAKLAQVIRVTLAK